MNDIIGYNERMRATMEDKMWFVSHLPEHIDTIIDFGCADGSLMRALDEKYPGRFKFYFGIDESEEMINLALRHPDNKKVKMQYNIIANVNALKLYGHFKPKHSVLILNSVIHEMFNYKNDAKEEDVNFYGSYSHCKYFDTIMKDIEAMGVPCIAIRDMYAKLECYYDAIALIRKLEQCKVKEQFDEYHSYFSKNYHEMFPGFMYVGNYVVFDFLMKWFYTDNWDREMKEFYFWNWLPQLLMDHTYPIKHVEYFNIPYVVDKAKELGVDMYWNTHAKLLLMKK